MEGSVDDMGCSGDETKGLDHDLNQQQTRQWTKIRTMDFETEIVQRLDVVPGYGNYELRNFFGFFVDCRMTTEN